MVTLKNFQKIYEEYHGLKRIDKSVGLRFVEEHDAGQKTPCVRTDKGLEAERARVAEGMIKAIPLLKAKHEIREKLVGLSIPSEFVDVKAKCSGCGEEFTTKHSVYSDFDFKKALCPDCVSHNENKDQATIIEKATNIKAIYDSDNLTGISLVSGGKTYILNCESEDGYQKPLTLEEE